MTPHYSSSQNHMKLIALFLFTVMISVTCLVLKGRYEHANAASPNSRMFLGVKHLSPNEIHSLVPEIKGKPAVIEFHSKLCHDCKKITPIMEQLTKACPGVVLKKYDILNDRKTQGAVFRGFNPVSVPILLFVDKKGDIKNVLYNAQTKATLSESVDQIKPASCKVKG